MGVELAAARSAVAASLAEATNAARRAEALEADLAAVRRDAAELAALVVRLFELRDWVGFGRATGELVARHHPESATSGVITPEPGGASSWR
ncbi:hypothetical protein [Salana multivorans]